MHRGIGKCITTVIMTVILFFISAGTAWAVSGDGEITNFLDKGDIWQYHLVHTIFQKGAYNRSNYFNPKSQHCTRLKSNGSWRSAKYADAGRWARDEDVNTRTNPFGSADATAGKLHCTVFYAPSSSNTNSDTSDETGENVIQPDNRINSNSADIATPAATDN